MVSRWKGGRQGEVRKMVERRLIRGPWRGEARVFYTSKKRTKSAGESSKERKERRGAHSNQRHQPNDPTSPPTLQDIRTSLLNDHLSDRPSYESPFDVLPEHVGVDGFDEGEVRSIEGGGGVGGREGRVEREEGDRLREDRESVGGGGERVGG